MNDRSCPYNATLKERYRLSKEGSPKEVYHITLDIAGSGIEYQVGDSIGIYPRNSHETVDATIKSIDASGDEMVMDTKRGDSLSLRQFLTERANITAVTKKLVDLVANPGLQDLDRQALKAIANEHHVWDFLNKYKTDKISPQELCDNLLHLLPRLYSIASSQKSCNDEVHLTIAMQQYCTGGHTRYGVATRFLCHETPLNEPVIPIYLQSGHHFRLPENPDTPIIMVGAGTGIAPFRAFLQERSSAKKNWLFFGQCTSNHDFYYEDFWKELIDSGALQLETAFSRDQEHKIYVQHRISEKGEELMQWLEKGALFYVCGDAKRMAKDVDQALHQVVCEHGGKSDEEAKAYLKQLRTEKRYLRDIY